jgi:hypothetical protein
MIAGCSSSAADGRGRRSGIMGKGREPQFILKADDRIIRVDDQIKQAPGYHDRAALPMETRRLGFGLSIKGLG